MAHIVYGCPFQLMLSESDVSLENAILNETFEIHTYMISKLIWDFISIGNPPTYLVSSKKQWNKLCKN